MPFDPSLKAWLSLSLIQGLGSEGIRHLLKQFASPEAVYAASPDSLKPFAKTAVVRAIAHGIDHEAIAPALAWLEADENHLVTLADEDYPQALLNITDPPVLLYVKGRLDLLNRTSVAIVGSRNATPQGIVNAEDFACALSNAGLCIISGMALGIDAAAHRGALRGQGGSIAVVGTGLDKVYPAANRDLAYLLAGKGALISEFPLGTPPLGCNFPRRNRLISGMSVGTLVVEASIQSGSLITAKQALEQGRDVFAIPGSIHSPQSRGCHALIKQGAKLAETAQDILEELTVQLKPTVGVAEKPEAKNTGLLTLTGFDPVSMDQLCQRSGLTVSQLSAMLLALELEGRIAVLPGGLFQRIH